MKKLAFSALFTAIAMTAFAQTHQPHGTCGMTSDQQIFSQWHAEQRDIAVERGVLKYVPIHFHLTANSDNIGRLRYKPVLDLLCQMNKDYVGVDFRFYLSPHPTFGLFDETINSDGVYTSQTNETLMQNKRHGKAMNIYVVNDAVSGNNNPGLTLAYYKPSRDWVVTRKDQVNGATNNGTMQHEVGHFFSLMHTFFGWESNPFDAADAGWPKAPVLSPFGNQTEKQDGSNGTVAADEIKDTPPDYNFGLNWNGCSAYTAGAQDPTGVVVDPMENNFMGYFQNCSDYQFTPGQVSEMQKNLELTSRNYLDNTFVPAAETLASPADLLIEPISTTNLPPFYDQVNFSWKPVAGATYFLFEIDINNIFSTNNYQQFIFPASQTSLLLTNLKKNTQYFWRVRPFNEYFTCDPGKTINFRTPATSGTRVPEIEAVTDWKLQPNPISSRMELQIAVEASQNFEANVRITNSIGQQVYSKNGLNFAAGDNLISVENTALTPGIYQVFLTSGDALMSKKLVVGQ